jgi:hypothetical protein
MRRLKLPAFAIVGALIAIWFFAPRERNASTPRGAAPAAPDAAEEARNSPPPVAADLRRLAYATGWDDPQPVGLAEFRGWVAGYLAAGGDARAGRA